jgi:hypothetical protein
MELMMKRMPWVLSFFSAAAILVVPGAAQEVSDEQSKIRQGFAIMQGYGIPLKLRGKNPALVGLGSYIVNAQADCNGCHGNPQWAPGGDPFLGQPAVTAVNGYLVGGGPLFGPVFVPRNLTPNAAGLPAGLTLEQFIRTMRTGRDRRPTGDPPDSDLLQIMPWPNFRNMTNRDLSAIYEFLSAIPCLEGSRPGRCSP